MAPIKTYHGQNGMEGQSLVVTVAWLATKADCQPFFHGVITTTGDKSDQTGCHDGSR